MHKYGKKCAFFLGGCNIDEFTEQLCRGLEDTSHEREPDKLLERFLNKKGFDNKIPIFVFVDDASGDVFKAILKVKRNKKSTWTVVVACTSDKERRREGSWCKEINFNVPLPFTHQEVLEYFDEIASTERNRWTAEDLLTKFTRKYNSHFEERDMEAAEKFLRSKPVRLRLLAKQIVMDQV